VRARVLGTRARELWRGEETNQPRAASTLRREVTAQMDTMPAPTSASEAMDMVRAGLGYLAATDPTQLATEEQAQVLR
jgi:hypothetical protein